MSDERQPRPFSDEQAYQQYVDSNQSQEQLDQAVDSGRVIEQQEHEDKTYETMSMAELARIIGEAEANGDVSTSNEAQHYLEEKIEHSVAGMSDELPVYKDLHGNDVVDQISPRQVYREKLVDKYLSHALKAKESVGDDELYTSFAPEKIADVTPGAELAQVVAEELNGVDKKVDRVEEEVSDLKEELDGKLNALKEEFEEKIKTLATKQPRRVQLGAEGQPKDEIQKLVKYENGDLEFVPAAAEATETAEDGTRVEGEQTAEVDTFTDLEGRLTPEQIAVLQAHAREQKEASRAQEMDEWDKEFNELSSEVSSADDEKPEPANQEESIDDGAAETQPESIEALNEAAKKALAENRQLELRGLREGIDELKAKEIALRNEGKTDEADSLANEIIGLQNRLDALEKESRETEPGETLTPNLDEVEPSAEPEDVIPHERAKRNWIMRKVDWVKAKFWQKTTEGQAAISEARDEAAVAAHGDKYDEYVQSIVGKNARTDRFKAESEAELKEKYGEEGVTEDQIDALVRKKERAFQKSIENTGWNHIKNLWRETRRPIEREVYTSDEQYKDAKSHKRKVILGAVATGAPIAIVTSLLVARGFGAFEHMSSGAEADIIGTDAHPGVQGQMSDEQFKHYLDSRDDNLGQHETTYPPLTEIDPQPGEYTGNNIHVDYNDYLQDKVSAYAMGTHLDMTSTDTALGGLFDRAEGGPDQATQMAHTLTESQKEQLGLGGLNTDQIEDKLHDNTLRAETLNLINTDIENGSTQTSILTTDDLRQLEATKGDLSMYNWGARPVDENGNFISIEEARARGITDTELVQYTTTLQDLIDRGASLLKVTNADGETVYFNSLCQNMLTEIPHHDVPIVVEPDTGSEGTGTEGTGSEGTGSEGTGTEGTGSEGTGSEGTGTEGTGDEGTGSEGTGNEGGDEKHYDGGVDTAPGIDPSHNTYDPGTDDTEDPATSGNGTDSPSMGEGGAPIQQPGETVDIQAPDATGNESPQVTTPEQGANGGTGINQTPEGAAHEQAQEQAQQQQDQANSAAEQMESQMSQPGAVDQAVKDAQAGIDPVTGRPIGQR